MKIRRIESILFALALASTSASATMPDASPNGRAEITNWQAPATWTPAAAVRDPEAAKQDAEAAALSGLRTPLIIIPPVPVGFVPLTPCRLVDTRAGSGFPAGYGPPSMAGGGTQRTFVFTGQCGVPAGAQAISMNIAVWAPPTRGDARVFPAGAGTPLVSTLNWEAGILALANAAVIQVGTAGGITVQIDGASTVDIFIDVNGYYGPNGSLPSGSAYLSNTAASTDTYTYPVTVTMPNGGACLVMSTAQFTLSTTLPTVQGPFFRIGINRGGLGDGDDGLYGFYFVPPAVLGKSNDMTRHAVITINPNEATQLGCFVSLTSDANWQKFYRCRTSYLCY